MSVLSNVLILGLALWLILVIGKFIILFILLLQSVITADQMMVSMDMLSLDTWFNFDIWGYNNITSLIRNVIVVFFVIAFLSTIVFRQNILSLRMPKDKYQKDNYTSFQNRFERKRALYRVQYDDKGNVTRLTLECFFDWLFRPTVALQNAIMAEYNRPVYEYWNFQKLHAIPKTKPIETLKIDHSDVKDVDDHTSRPSDFLVNPEVKDEYTEIPITERDENTSNREVNDEVKQ